MTSILLVASNLTYRMVINTNSSPFNLLFRQIEVRIFNVMTVLDHWKYFSVSFSCPEDWKLRISQSRKVLTALTWALTSLNKGAFRKTFLKKEEYSIFALLFTSSIPVSLKNLCELVGSVCVCVCVPPVCMFALVCQASIKTGRLCNPLKHLTHREEKSASRHPKKCISRHASKYSACLFTLINKGKIEGGRGRVFEGRTHLSRPTACRSLQAGCDPVYYGLSSRRPSQEGRAVGPTGQQRRDRYIWHSSQGHGKSWEGRSNTWSWGILNDIFHQSLSLSPQHLPLALFCRFVVIYTLQIYLKPMNHCFKMLDSKDKQNRVSRVCNVIFRV